MGGRDGAKLQRLGFLARRAYEPSSSPLVFASRASARNLHENFESVAWKKLARSKKIVIGLDLRDLGWAM
ncbi:unnamed protein product [Prunus armeniaca]